MHHPPLAQLAEDSMSLEGRDLLLGAGVLRELAKPPPPLGVEGEAEAEHGALRALLLSRALSRAGPRDRALRAEPSLVRGLIGRLLGALWRCREAGEAQDLLYRRACVDHACRAAASLCESRVAAPLLLGEGGRGARLREELLRAMRHPGDFGAPQGAAAQLAAARGLFFLSRQPGAGGEGTNRAEAWLGPEGWGEVVAVLQLEAGVRVRAGPGPGPTLPEIV